MKCTTFIKAADADDCQQGQGQLLPCCSELCMKPDTFVPVYCIIHQNTKAVYCIIHRKISRRLHQATKSGNFSQTLTYSANRQHFVHDPPQYVFEEVVLVHHLDASIGFVLMKN